MGNSMLIRFVSHESGHTFGAVHDCDTPCESPGESQCCPLSSSQCEAEGRYIMNPSTSSVQTRFSACTIGNICSGLGRTTVNSSCLVNPRNISTINSGKCGNGIVEADEDCDCGGVDSCAQNSCCDPDTCRFRESAVCDDDSGVCCSGCQFSSPQTVCRSQNGPCDIEETCTGLSSSCPEDGYEPNGNSCGNSMNLSCASGVCTSRDLQCQEATSSLMNISQSEACDMELCGLRCSASTSPNFCMDIGQSYLDGTPCGSGSMCNSGICYATSGTTNTSWLRRHVPLLLLALQAGFLSWVF